MSKDWSLFDDFRRPLEPRSWDGVGVWVSDLETRVGADRSALARQRHESDRLLRDLGGDPSARDWTSFLPLRRHREEDWSDWLAQLIEDSATGQFACALFGRTEGRLVDAYRGPTVHREVPSEEYRADLVIEWCDASYTHVEVKVGDPDLAKMLETSRQTEKRFGRSAKRRSDNVLLLPSQADAWDMECIRHPDMSERVRMLTWISVARALRHALLGNAGESIHWRVWAHAFCGAVEQDLLGLRSGVKPSEWAQSLSLQGMATAATLFRPNGDE